MRCHQDQDTAVDVAIQRASAAVLFIQCRWNRYVGATMVVISKRLVDSFLIDATLEVGL